MVIKAFLKVICFHLYKKPIQMVTGFGSTIIPNIQAIPRKIGLLKMELITGRRHQNHSMLFNICVTLQFDKKMLTYKLTCIDNVILCLT